MGTFVFDFDKSYQFSTHEGLRLFGFCVVSSNFFFFQKKLESHNAWEQRLTWIKSS